MSFKVDSTIGAALIGFSVSCYVFGISTSQVFTYASRYPQDKIAYKLLVAFVWFLELVDQVFIGHAVYFYAITNFNAPLALITLPFAWSFILQILMGALVGTIVKLCFALRVWRFSNRNIPVTAIIVILTLTQLSIAIIYATKALQNPHLETMRALRDLGTISLATGALTDIITAIALSFFLHRLRTGYRGSNSLVNKLTLYAVNTGVLTSAVSLTTLVLYHRMPNNFIFVAFYFVLSKLYAISFLATLNTRKTIRGRGTDNQDEDSGAPTFLMMKSQLQVGIHQEVSVVSDIGHEEKFGRPQSVSEPSTSSEAGHNIWMD